MLSRRFFALKDFYPNIRVKGNRRPQKIPIEIARHGQNNRSYKMSFEKPKNY